MTLTDSDIAYIKDAPLADLREELYYAKGRDEEYAAALAKEILRRSGERPRCKHCPNVATVVCYYPHAPALNPDYYCGEHAPPASECASCGYGETHQEKVTP